MVTPYATAVAGISCITNLASGISPHALSHAEVIDVTKLNAGARVVFGATVELADVDTDEQKTYQIVGDLEADIKAGLIAISSPVARALIGKNEGDSITIDAPGGTREYEIVSVRYLG